MIRPFRRIDVIRALQRADTAKGSADAELVKRLLRRVHRPRGLALGRGGARRRAGAITRTRRDLMRPDGPDGLQPYVDVRLEGVFGPVVAVSRPAVEPRLTDDPDWRGRKDLTRRRAHARGVSRTAVQVGALLVRAAGPELGAGGLLGHSHQPVRLPPHLSRPRRGLTHGAAAGAGGPAARRGRRHRRDHQALPLRPPPRRALLRPAARGAVGDHGVRRQRPRASRAPSSTPSGSCCSPTSTARATTAT